MTGAVTGTEKLTVAESAAVSFMVEQGYKVTLPVHGVLTFLAGMEANRLPPGTVKMVCGLVFVVTTLATIPLQKAALDTRGISSSGVVSGVAELAKEKLPSNVSPWVPVAVGCLAGTAWGMATNPINYGAVVASLGGSDYDWTSLATGSVLGLVTTGVLDALIITGKAHFLVDGLKKLEQAKAVKPLIAGVRMTMGKVSSWAMDGGKLVI